MQVLTKGTFFDINNVSYEPRYVLALQIFMPDVVSVAVLESSKNEIFLGNFQDDQRFNSLKKLLAETKPLEVIYSPTGLTEDIYHMLTTCYFKPQLTKLSKADSWHRSICVEELDRLFLEKKKWPEIILNIEQNCETADKDMLFSTISGLFS